MKTKTTNKLQAYSLTAIALMSGASTANADVIYTPNPNPDNYSISGNGGEYFQLDLNNDGIIDCSFGIYYYSYGYVQRDVMIYLYNSCYVAGAQPSSTYVFARAYEVDQPIGNSADWYSGSVGFYYSSTSYSSTSSFSSSYGMAVLAWVMGTSSSMSTLGYFLGKSDKYLGLRIKAEGKNHYGWVRMDVSGDATSFVLKDHAYESIPDKSINAGDIAVGIESINRDETVIYSYRQNVIIKSEYKGVAIVYDLSGREVRRNDIRKGTNTMNLDVATNYYMVRVHTNRGSESKKVHIRAK